MALTDALTLLPNRHWLNQFLSDELDSLRAADKQIALFYLDLDDFKKINDTLGHKIGDHYLESVAQILRQAVRQGDHVVRLGGDEFTILVSMASIRTISTRLLRIFCMNCTNLTPVLSGAAFSRVPRWVLLYFLLMRRMRLICCRQPISRCTKPS
jgi:diguanylate cyclase (GGDEF)-like protein